MPIGNVMERGRFVYIYDEKGRQIGTIGLSFDEDQLSGYTSTTVSIKRGATTYLYDEKGRMTSSVHDPFYNSRSNNPRNSSSSQSSNNSGSTNGGKSKKGCGWIIFIIIVMIIGLIIGNLDDKDKSKSSMDSSEIPEDNSSEVVPFKILDEEYEIEEDDYKSFESESTEESDELLESTEEGDELSELTEESDRLFESESTEKSDELIEEESSNLQSNGRKRKNRKNNQR